MATIAIDQPNHGSRGPREGGYVLDLAHPKRVARVTSIPPQAAIDTAAVVATVETALADLDVAPARFSLFGGLKTGDGNPDLDPSRVFYDGISMGGIFGTTFIGVAPHIDAAYLKVAGTGMIQVLTEGIVGTAFDAKRALPSGGTGGQAAVAMAALQHVMDVGEGANFVQYIRKPVNKAEPTPTLLVYGQDDSIVPNITSERLLLLADLPLFGPIIENVPGAPHSPATVGDPPADGFGALQIPSAGSFPNSTSRSITPPRPPSRRSEGAPRGRPPERPRHRGRLVARPTHGLTPTPPTGSRGHACPTSAVAVSFSPADASVCLHLRSPSGNMRL